MKLKQINPKTWKVCKSANTDVEGILNSWGFPTKVELACGNTVTLNYNDTDAQELLKLRACDFMEYFKDKNYREDTVKNLLGRFYNTSKRLLVDLYNEGILEETLEKLSLPYGNIHILTPILKEKHRRVVIFDGTITLHLELSFTGEILETNYHSSKTLSVSKKQTSTSLQWLKTMDKEASHRLHILEEALKEVTLLGAFKEDIDDGAV